MFGYGWLVLNNWLIIVNDGLRSGNKQPPDTHGEFLTILMWSVSSWEWLRTGNKQLWTSWKYGTRMKYLQARHSLDRVIGNLEWHDSVTLFAVNVWQVKHILDQTNRWYTDMWQFVDKADKRQVSAYRCLGSWDQKAIISQWFWNGDEQHPIFQIWEFVAW